MPAILFFPNDWLSDEGLRACSLPARALWIDMLCLMHKSPRRGFLQHQSGEPYTAAQLARVAGCAVVEVDAGLYELKTAGVYSCTDAGVIYNRRMVRDENKRAACSEAGRRGGGNPTFKGHPKGTPKGHSKGTLEDEDVFESEISFSELQNQAEEKMRAERAREAHDQAAYEAAKAALTDWVGKGQPVLSGMARAIEDALDAIRDARADWALVPRAIRHLRDKATPMKSLAYVTTIIVNTVKSREWEAWIAPEAKESPKERGARIAAKVEAELAARNGKHK